MLIWRLLPRGRGETPVVPEPSIPDAPSPPPRRRDPLSLALAEMEAAALQVYALHGLPTRPGHYEKPPRARRWRFIAEHLPPSARFQRALEQTPESGWRFARLEDLGARSGKPDLAAAADLLGLARRLREAREGALVEEDLLIAMELGAAWRANREILIRAGEPRATPRRSKADRRAKTS